MIPVLHRRSARRRPVTAAVSSYLSLDGSSGCYAKTVDSAALSITGDIDVRAKVAATDYTPSAEQTLVAKSQVSGAFYFAMLTDGTLIFSWTDSGGTFRFVISTAASGVTNGQDKHLRATLDVDNGAAGRDVKFYVSDDGAAWTQLGATITAAGTTSIMDTVDELSIGARNGGSATNFSGSIYSAEVRNGIGGTVQFSADFTAESPGTTSFTESSANAATVTLHGTAAIVAA
jgi:hypothetical protein